jgi:aspartyl protease family protein
VSRRLIVVVCVGVALFVVAMLGQQGYDLPGGLGLRETGAVAYNAGLIVLIGGGVVVMFRKNIWRALEALLFWAAIVAVLAVGYAYRAELGVVGDRVMAELVPGRAVTRGPRTVEIVRGLGGDFQVAAQVNGTRIALALDTGASTVVLTQDAARAAGLPLEVLNYDVPVDTANGRTRAASVTLDRLAVGDIVERNVPALIAPSGQLRTSLLGMSFLNRLESWEVRGDKLLMRGKPAAGG